MIYEVHLVFNRPYRQTSRFQGRHRHANRKSLGILERNHAAGAACLIGGQDNAQVHQTVLG